MDRSDGRGCPWAWLKCDVPTLVLGTHRL